MTSVYISATAGNAPYIQWTIAMEFLPKDQYVEIPNTWNKYNKWYYEPQYEPIATNEVTDTDVKILQ